VREPLAISFMTDEEREKRLREFEVELRTRGLDESFVPELVRINQIPGIVTCLSCDGKQEGQKEGRIWIRVASREILRMICEDVMAEMAEIWDRSGHLLEISVSWQLSWERDCLRPLLQFRFHPQDGPLVVHDFVNILEAKLR